MEMNRTKVNPIEPRRSMRFDEITAITSLPAGKVVPIAYVPLLREDAVRSGRMRLSFEMAETVELLANAVNVNVQAHLVPKLALERFNGMDQLNRSYMGEPEVEGGDVIPWFETQAFGAHGSNEVYKYLGLHAKADQDVNTDLLEAYNAVWNFRARNRSKDLTPRSRLATTLAPAFQLHTTMRHIVPDFDQALIDGEVALNVVNSALPLRGLGTELSNTPGGSVTVQETGGVQATYDNHYRVDSLNAWYAEAASATAGAAPAIFAELAANGITVSLSNIDAAKRTAAFARLRQMYQGLEDDYIVDLLMQGVRVPEQAMKQPILLAQRRTIFGYSKRYASDAGNLTESVVNGLTQLDLMLRVPQINTGGIILVTAEISPEPLFERQKDYYLQAGSVDVLPNYLRDELDPEKVAVVQNDHVDVDHDTPDATFGYAPLNHEWMRSAPRIGGKFYRPTVDASFDEDRQRFWAVETENPTLGPDFYLCTTMHTKVFADTVSDPFEVVGRGRFDIEGNTVFGATLYEASDDYETVAAQVPQDRIEKE